MRRFLMAALTLLFACAASDAQTTIAPSGMGATSPLGTMGSSGASGFTAAGVSLGATEINPGGLGPTVGSSCNASGSTGGSGTTSSAPSTFDGGGMTSSNNCATTSSGGSTSSQPSTSSSSVVGRSIPLGATETGIAGLSPLLVVPVPNTSTYGGSTPVTTPCATGSASSTTGGTSTSAASSPSGC